MIRVEVTDAENAETLVRKLAGAHGPTAVSLDPDRREVRVEEQHRSREAIARILRTIQDWLDEATVDSATVWLNEVAYTLAKRQPQTAGRRRADGAQAVRS